MGRRTRWAVVLGDDEILRKGRCAAVAEADDLQLIGDAALESFDGSEFDWSRVDLLVVDAYRDGSHFDRFVGVGAIERIAHLTGRRQPRTLVVGPKVASPFLTLRLAEAGADHLYLHDEVSAIAAFLAAVRRPDRAHAPDLAAASAQIPGLRRPTNVNRLLDELDLRGLLDAFDPGLPQGSSGLTRRQNINTRNLVHHTAKLDAGAHLRTGGCSSRGRVPSWREVVDFVNSARGYDLRTEW